MTNSSSFESGSCGEENEDEFKRAALREAVICIGWLKLISVAYYVLLYFLVHVYSAGEFSTLLQVMLLLALPLQVLHGCMLFYGALENKLTTLEVNIWLCLIIASYNTVLGTLGCIFFIRVGKEWMHFLLAVGFVFLAFSLCAVLCHDILMVYAYKQIVNRIREQEILEVIQCCG